VVKLSWIVGLLLVPSAALAACPDIGIAPRTITAPATDYVASKGFSLDEDGVIVFDYGTRYGGEVGKFANPYFLTNYANALYRDYLDTQCTSDELLTQFMLQADHLMATADVDGKVARWTYPFPIEEYELDAGWISGIGQARIAGVLHRAAALTGKASYHEMAEAAMQVYVTPPQDGGVATIDGEVIWIEEYADPSGTSYKVLNGHITALGGILDYYEITGEQEWLEVFDRGVAAVRRDITSFDAGFLSYYSLYSPGERKYAPRGGYNALHVSQLLWLYDITGEGIFLEWASRFQAYEAPNILFTAKGSVDPAKHGPDGAEGRYGSAYWSHADFPTWIQADVPERAYSGLAVHGNGDKAVPSDFSILARKGAGWTVVETVKGNTAKTFVASFEQPITTSAFRVFIESDNGNNNVALQAVLPAPTTSGFSAITNECNYRTAGKNYNFDLAMDGDPSTAMRVYCDGWLILPTNGLRRLSVDGPAGSLDVSFSDDLTDWRQARPVEIGAEAIDTEGADFVRLSFTAASTPSISEVWFSSQGIAMADDEATSALTAPR